jgi:hypothetical protein
MNGMRQGFFFFLSIARRVVRAAVPTRRKLRLAAYWTFAFGLVAALGARSVYADAREVGFAVGHQLASPEDLTEGAYTLRLNGATLHRSMARTPLSVGEVLDRYEAHCAESPSAIGRAMRDIPEALADKAEIPKEARKLGILRDEADGRGMVACFVDQADEADRSAAVIDRVNRFFETGDLASFGHVRYVFVEARKSGSKVVTLWSDGPLKIGAMFPAEGDAPGTDSSLVPRPSGSRRTLSAAVDGYPAAVRIYETAEGAEGVARAADAALVAKGFVRATSDSAQHGAAYARRDGAQVFLSWSSEGGRTAVTILESAAAPVEGAAVTVR